MSSLLLPAEKLHLDLDVPVGIIHTALGASKMICWLPEEKMESLPYLKKINILDVI